AQRQDQSVQQWPPQQLWNLDHERVAEEFAEVAFHRVRGRRFGRAEVDQDDGGVWRRAAGRGGWVRHAHRMAGRAALGIDMLSIATPAGSTHARFMASSLA